MCPYCQEKIIRIGSIISCTWCRFKIDVERAREIAENRAGERGNVDVRIRWQFLHQMRCPLCTGMLYPASHNEDLHVCRKEGCNFKIREDRVQMILADSRHPANRFNHNVECN